MSMESTAVKRVYALKDFSRGLQEEIVRALDMQHFHLMMSPTERCNFRCVYCYEDFAIGRMSSEVIQGIKALLSRKIPTLKSLSFSWFGGEPLLALPVIADLSSFAKAECERSHVSFQGDLATNAWELTPENAAQLVGLRQVGFQISLDGDQDWHDQTRLKANGQGSFERIWTNLIALRETDLKFNVKLRLHLHGSNIPSMERLIGRLNDTFSGDERYKAFFHPVSNYGGFGAGAVKYLSTDEYVRQECRLQSKLALSLVSTGGTQICYAAKPNSLFVRPNGQVAKCTVALDAPFNNLGQLDSDGNVQLSAAKLGAWAAPLYEGAREDRQCPLKFVTERHDAQQRTVSA